MFGGEYRGIPIDVAAGPGRDAICLMFRVGMADEALPQRGLTHLIEHLILRDHADHRVQINGMVDLLACRFVATGEAEGLWEFVDTVLDRLAGLDGRDVPVEQGVLGVESLRGASLAAEHHLRRFGSRGPGRSAYPELALRSASVEELITWRDRYFTSTNAAIWSTVPPTRDGAPVLPPGEPCPPITTPPLLTALGQFRLPGQLISVSALVPRSILAPLAVEAFRRQLEQRLRTEAGLSYAVLAGYEPVGAEDAVVLVSVDSADERSGRVVQMISEQISSFIDEGPDAGRWASFLAEIESQAARLEDVSGWLDHQALARLVGSARQSRDELACARRAATAAGLGGSLTALRDVPLWQLPPSTRAVTTNDLDALRDPEAAREIAVDYTNLYEPYDLTGRLVAGGRRVSLSRGARRVAVDLDELEACLSWGDGTRELIDHRGRSLVVEPSLWRGGRRVVAWIDEKVPEAQVVRRGFRHSAPVMPLAPVGRIWNLLRASAAPLSGFALVVLALAAVNGVALVAAIAALVIVAAVAWAVRETTCREPIIYEIARQRAAFSDVPPEIGSHAAARFGAPVLLWAYRAGRLSEPLLTSEAQLLGQLDDETVEPEDVFWRLGGVLASDMFEPLTKRHLDDLMLRSGHTRSFAGVLPYPLVISGHRFGKESFLETTGRGPIESAARELEANFTRWKQRPWFHRATRLLLIGPTSLYRGSGHGAVRRWRRLRLRRRLGQLHPG